MRSRVYYELKEYIADGNPFTIADADRASLVSWIHAMRAWGAAFTAVTVDADTGGLLVFEDCNAGIAWTSPAYGASGGGRTLRLFAKAEEAIALLGL